MINPIVYLITLVLNLYEVCVFIYVIMSFLIHFRIVNFTHPFVKIIWDILYRIIEPILKRIRKFVPSINGVDLSPVVLLIALSFIHYTIRYYFGP